MVVTKLTIIVKAMVLCSFVFLTIKSVMASCSKPKCNVPSAWRQIGSDICYGTNYTTTTNGAKQSKTYDFITFDEDCELVGLRLRHVSGGFTPIDSTIVYTWGETGAVDQKFWTVVTNSTNDLIYPSEVDQWGLYQLDGFKTNDPLIYFNNYPPIDVKKGVEYRLWFDLDLVSFELQINGDHCVDVDVSCLV